MTKALNEQETMWLLFVSSLLIMLHETAAFALRRSQHFQMQRRVDINHIHALRTVAPRVLTSRFTTPLTQDVSQRDASFDNVNGDHSRESPWKLLEGVNITVSANELLPSAPPLSYNKFLIMQDKRVVVTIRYSSGAGLKPYFLTVAKKLKASHTDVIIERRILPSVDKDEGEEATFEVLVDGKIVVGKGRPRKQKVARVDMSWARSVFVSMQELDLNISRARRRRRPSTMVYGEDNPQAPLEGSQD